MSPLPLAKRKKPTAPAVRPPNRRADMPGAVVPPADRLHAKDLAALEDCSLSTARRLMHSGQLGRVRGRSTRDRWVTRSAYESFLQSL